jgi:hypothetical protein
LPMPATIGITMRGWGIGDEIAVNSLEM